MMTNRLRLHKKFCTICGTGFEVVTQRQQYVHSLCQPCNHKYPEQNSIKLSGRKRYCGKCGGTISANEPGQVKLCAKCRPWSAVNRKGVDLKVIGECQHETAYRKHHHHPDYRLPFEVFLMCGSCHILEHSIIRQCEKNGEYDSQRHLERKAAWERYVGEQQKTKEAA